jgi:hypothetical protein
LPSCPKTTPGARCGLIPEESTVQLGYFVRTVRRDGSVNLSYPFLLESKACRWARIAARDTEHVARVLMIVC